MYIDMISMEWIDMLKLFKCCPLFAALFVLITCYGVIWAPSISLKDHCCHNTLHIKKLIKSRIPFDADGWFTRKNSAKHCIPGYLSLNKMIRSATIDCW